MFTYILIQRIYDGDSYHNPEVLGTFTNLIAVNRYIKTATDFEDVKFISCRQICEFPVGDTHYQLELTSVPHNPYNRIGELADIFADEPTIAELEDSMDTQPDFLEHKRKGYSIHSYFHGDSMSLQFWGWAIVLKEDGTYFWEDTSGG